MLELASPLPTITLITAGAPTPLPEGPRPPHHLDWTGLDCCFPQLTIYTR